MTLPTYTARVDVFKREYASPTDVKVPCDFAIFNKAGSGKIVHIQNLQFVENSTTLSVTTVPTYLFTQKITAHVASEQILQPAKYDSTNTTLPAQVVACRFPSSVSLTGDVLRKHPKQNNYSPAVALNSLFARLHRGGKHTEGNDVILSNYNTNAQYVTLREGEGLALHCNDTNNFTMIIELTVGIRNQATGDCYLYKVPCYTHFLPLFSIMNGAGSGVVLEVFHVSCQDTGTILIGRWAVEPIVGIQSHYDEQVQVVPHDSAVPLADGILITQTAQVTTKIVSATDFPHYRSFSNLTADSLNMLTPGSTLLYVDKSVPRNFSPVMSKTGVMLEEGQGIALISRNDSVRGMYNAVCTFCVEDAPTTAGEFFF